MHTKPRKQITVLSIILMAAAVLYLSFILQTSFRIKGQTYFTLIDDAMVSMRYAQHLAHGQGLVWNIGEKPVEGFTNPGWMLYMSFWHLFQLSGSQISLLVMLTSALVLLANILIVHRICQILQPESKYAPLLAATLTAFYFPLIFWSLRGMEVGILTLLVDLAVLLSIRFTRAPEKRFSLLLSLVFIAALIIRMDVLLPILLLVAYLV